MPSQLPTSALHMRARLERHWTSSSPDPFRPPSPTSSRKFLYLNQFSPRTCHNHRAAENRTRSACSQSRCTTGILRPASAKATAGIARFHFAFLLYTNLWEITNARHSVSAAEPHENAVHLPLPFPLFLKDIPLPSSCDLPYLRFMQV